MHPLVSPLASERHTQSRESGVEAGPTTSPQYSREKACPDSQDSTRKSIRQAGRRRAHVQSEEDAVGTQKGHDLWDLPTSGFPDPLGY